jgi:hypothetical protein
MACEAQELINDIPCDLCAIPPGLVPYAVLVLLCAIRDGDTMACDPQSLLDEANCLQCALTPGMVGYAQLAVLCGIASGGSGGAGQVMEYTTTDPTTDGITPTNVNEPAIAYRDDGSLPIFVWNTTTHIWQ